MYFDTHTHYDSNQFKADMHEVIKEQKNNNVTLITNIGANIKSSEQSVQLAKEYDFIYATVGVHPHDVDSLKDSDINILKELATKDKVVAIGEIGMDLYYEHSKKENQLIWFKKQLKLAEQLNLPVVIHSRDADQLVFDTIKESKIRKGIIHCYSGSYEMAKQYVKLGFHIGIGGVITFKNAVKLVKVVENIPIESLVLETDLPYLSPVPHRGKRNESKFLNVICEKVAELKNMEHDEVAKITFENAKKVYNI